MAPAAAVGCKRLLARLVVGASLREFEWFDVVKACESGDLGCAFKNDDLGLLSFSTLCAG